MGILIVDDQSVICEYLAGLFSPEVSVTTAGTLEDALTALSHHNFALVISDLSLKGREGREGFEILSHVRVTSPGTKVMIMTGTATDDVKAEALKLGATHFLRKPLDIPYLVTIVREGCGLD